MTFMERIELPTDGSAHSNRSSILTKIWPSVFAGFAGSAVHSCLMILKSRAGLLPSFQPYDDLQRLLGDLVGGSVQRHAARRDTG
jgi:hypothetical protein